MLPPTRTRLAFHIDNIYGGLARLNGILRVEADALGLEFQIKDSVLGGMIKSTPKQVSIPYSELEEVVYKQNLFITQFRLAVMSLEGIGSLPANDKGVVKLQLARSDRKKARELASHINLQLSEYRLRMMDEDGY